MIVYNYTCIVNTLSKIIRISYPHFPFLDNFPIVIYIFPGFKYNIFIRFGISTGIGKEQKIDE